MRLKAYSCIASYIHDNRNMESMYEFFSSSVKILEYVKGQRSKLIFQIIRSSQSIYISAQFKKENCWNLFANELYDAKSILSYLARNQGIRRTRYTNFIHQKMLITMLIRKLITKHEAKHVDKFLET